MEELSESKHKAQRKKIYVKDSSSSIEDLLADSPSEKDIEEKSEFLKIKPISFETKTHKTLKNAREKASQASSRLPSQINYPRLIIIISLIALIAGFAFWILGKQKSSSTQTKDVQTVAAPIEGQTSQEAIFQASVDAADFSDDPLEDKALSSEAADEALNDKDLSESNSSLEYRDGWNATYQSLDSLYTTEERSLVMLPAWLIGAPQKDRCFGEANKDCLPKNVLKINKRFCIETKFSNKSSDVEIAEVVGYFGNSVDKNIKTLSFDQYTAGRHKIKSAGVKPGVSWRLVKCPF
ncbi:MAG: hypothetical protein SFU25_04095 [Candidatus Caenarcaniphilales bacterium]|nr:hypothetical protein [Candidatus Caenarcaniphilales bacterium]